MSENKETTEPVVTGEKVEKNEKGQFVPGHTGIGGRPPGSKSFVTMFENAIKKLADSEEIDIDSAEAQLLIMAFKKAREGDFSFYKDIMDRVYGKSKDIVDVESQSLVEFIAKLKLNKPNE